jgi:hypothetical protein
MGIARHAAAGGGTIRLLVLASWLAGCAAPQTDTRAPRPTVKPGEFGSSACFFARQAQDFRVLDDRNVIVFAPTKSQAYHVQISPSATALRFANRMAFVSRNTQICGYAGDDLLLAEGPGERRYSVTGVYRLDEASLEALRARFGQAPPPAAAEPEPSEGAEIERDLGGDAGPE